MKNKREIFFKFMENLFIKAGATPEQAAQMVKSCPLRADAGLEPMDEAEAAEMLAGMEAECPDVEHWEAAMDSMMPRASGNN